MRLLLDTHVWLWMLAEPERLSARVQSMLASTDNEVALSAASVWEAGIKEALGKLPNTQPIATLVKSSVERFSLALLAITTDHALAAAALPKHHSHSSTVWRYHRVGNLRSPGLPFQHQ